MTYNVISSRWNHCISILTAMTIHAIATYGDSLSPIRADIQNNPKNPCLFLSTSPGATALIYVHVQIMRMMTNNND